MEVAQEFARRRLVSLGNPAEVILLVKIFIWHERSQTESTSGLETPCGLRGYRHFLWCEVVEKKRAPVVTGSVIRRLQHRSEIAVTEKQNTK